MGESGAKMAQQLTVASTAGTVIVEGSFPVASCRSSTVKADTREYHVRLICLTLAEAQDIVERLVYLTVVCRWTSIFIGHRSLGMSGEMSRQFSD